MSFRFGLRPKPTDSVLFSSPWSDFVAYDEVGKLQQMYIGDGSASMDTTRTIYLRTAASDIFGKEVGTITGHGIMTWPQDVHPGGI